MSEFDRAWMVVDEHGEMLPQRELPRLALVPPTLRTSDMVLRAPGMLALHIPKNFGKLEREPRRWSLEAAGAQRRARGGDVRLRGQGCGR